MCQAKSFICVKGEMEPHGSKYHDSHEKLIADLKLKDTNALRCHFARAEFFPKNKNGFEPSDAWKFVVDEEASVPAWFEEEKQLWKDRCWTVIEKKILPLIAKGTFPGDLRIEKPVKAGHLRSVGGDLNLNEGKKFTAPKLETVNGKPYERKRS